MIHRTRKPLFPNGGTVGSKPRFWENGRSSGNGAMGNKHCGNVVRNGLERVAGTPAVGSKLGSNLPVPLVAKSGLNGVESTISYKVNSRMTNFIRTCRS